MLKDSLRGNYGHKWVGGKDCLSERVELEIGEGRMGNNCLIGTGFPLG